MLGPISKTTLGLAALSLALCARGDDDTRTDRQKVAAQVRQTLKQGGMSDRDIAAMDADIDRHSADHGFGEAVSAAVHQAQASGCPGTCLAEAVHDVNRAMDRGHPADEAARMVGKAVAAAKGTEAQRRDSVHRDMAAALRDRHRDRTHDRAQDMAAGHGGGMMHGDRR